jgi:hypothetical protein
MNLKLRRSHTLSVLVIPPVSPQAESLSHVWPGRATWTSPSGDIETVVDTEKCEFHVTAPLGHPVDVLGAVMTKLASIGLEPMDELDGEEFLDDGRLRIYLVPTDPVSTTAVPIITIYGLDLSNEEEECA